MKTIIAALCGVVRSIIVHIDYHPSRLQPLPRSMCVSGRCVIPHYDIQAHSASVDWFVNETQVLAVDANATATWNVPVGNTSADCFILIDSDMSKSTISQIDDSDEDDPFLTPTAKCVVVVSEERDSYIVSLLRTNPLLQGLKETLFDVSRFDFRTWSLLVLSVLSAHFALNRGLRTRPTGVVRVSYTDPNRPTQYVQLPSSKYSKQMLTDEAIIQELIEKPGFSSFTVITAHSTTADN